MNVVREINKINEQELQLGVKGSWHDEYKDSAYVFVGGLSYDLTEGDVIQIMSQFGEVIDINMPRDKETGKPKGFSFLMYEDQRSTVLAVDNMNGAQVLGRTIRVDHCKKYEQRGTKNAEGDYVAPEEPTYNAMPPTLEGSSDEDSSDSEAEDLDEEDPMSAYLRQQKKTQKITDGKKRKRDGESKEERKARKEDKRRRKEERDRKRREREDKKVGTRRSEAGPSRARNGSASPRPSRETDLRRNGSGISRGTDSRYDEHDRRERGTSSRKYEDGPRDHREHRRQEDHLRLDNARRHRDDRDDVRRDRDETRPRADHSRQDQRGRHDDPRDRRRDDDDRHESSRRDYDQRRGSTDRRDRR